MNEIRNEIDCQAEKDNDKAVNNHVNQIVAISKTLLLSYSEPILDIGLNYPNA